MNLVLERLLAEKKKISKDNKNRDFLLHNILKGLDKAITKITRNQKVQSTLNL